MHWARPNYTIEEAQQYRSYCYCTEALDRRRKENSWDSCCSAITRPFTSLCSAGRNKGPNDDSEFCLSFCLHPKTVHGVVDADFFFLAPANGPIYHAVFIINAHMWGHFGRAPRLSFITFTPRLCDWLQIFYYSSTGAWTWFWGISSMTSRIGGGLRGCGGGRMIGVSCVGDGSMDGN